ncbi:MAG: hypothetical protein WAW96_22015 [Alphaproteobacteria bacterium]
MAGTASDLEWPVAPLREATTDSVGRKIRLALLAALGVSLLCHVILVSSLRFSRDNGLTAVVPVEIFELPIQVQPQATGKANVMTPTPSRQRPVESAPISGTSRAPLSVLGALWPELCASLDPAERTKLHLPDCTPSALSKSVLEKALPLVETIARVHGWVPGEPLPEIKGVDLDKPPTPGGIGLGNSVMPRTYPNLGAGSKIGAEDKDDRDQLKALWYLKGHHETR